MKTGGREGMGRLSEVRLRLEETGERETWVGVVKGKVMRGGRERKERKAG